MPVITYMLSMFISSLMFPLAQILLGLSQKNLVNAVEFNDQSYMLIVYISSATILVLVSVINPIAGFIQSRSVHRFMKNLRSKAIEKLVALPMAFFDNKHSGDIMTRINDDLEQVAEIYHWQLHRLMLALLYGVGSVSVMIFLSWRLTCVIIVLAVVQTVVISKASQRIQAFNSAIQEKLGSGNSLFIDIVKGIRFIRMYSLYNVMYRKYEDVNEDITCFTLTRNRHILGMNAISDMFEAVNIVGVLFVGIVMYFFNIVDLGSVMAFLVLQDGVCYMFSNLSEFFPGMQRCLASVKRLAEILDEPVEEDIETSVSTKTQAITSGDIRCECITFGYGGRGNCVIENLNCVIPERRVTTIKGASGGGKSTLVKLLLRLYKPDAGEIYIGNTPYAELSNAQIRGHFAYVPQSAYLFHDTIEANIRCGNETASTEQVIEAAKAACANEFIMEKPEGYRTLIQEHGGNLSGGQRQRIAIARAILKNAAVMIFDEATSAIDNKNEAQIHEYISRQGADGKTVLLVSHRTSASELSEHVISICAKPS